jgi:Tol biopolymer transport system component
VGDVRVMGLLVAILGLLGGLHLQGDAAHASCRCRAVADYGPVWSPDDSAIAYTQAYESAHVVSLGSASDNVTAAPAPSVVYSEDWSMAAAVVSDGAPDYSLVVFRPDGTDVRRLDRAFQTPPAWSPSGDQLAYIGADEGLYVIRPDGGERRQIAAHVYPYGARAASWSPDGSLLAFVSGKDVFVVSLAGGEPRNVTVGLDGTHVDPAWSPRGDALAIVTNFGADFDFVSSEGRPLFRLESKLPVAHGGISLSWSSDGEKVLYSYRFTPTPGSPGIYEVDTSARTQRLVSPFGIEASYSHDGTRIAFGG